MAADRWQLKLQERLGEHSPSGTAEDVFGAWVHTGGFVDHGRPQAVCDLCGNTGLRYQFLVAHRQTGEALWVGSQCVLHFDLSPASVEKRKRLARAQQDDPHINESQMAAILLSLKELYDQVGARDQRQIRWIMGKFQRRGGFSPADLSWLLQAMHITGVSYSPQVFPAILRTKKDKTEIIGLSVTARRLLWPCLTEEQKEAAEKLGVRGS